VVAEGDRFGVDWNAADFLVADFVVELFFLPF
jgi:hypothetical protein